MILSFLSLTIIPVLLYLSSIVHAPVDCISFFINLLFQNQSGINFKATAHVVTMEVMNPVLIIHQEPKHIPLRLVTTFEPDNFGRFTM